MQPIWATLPGLPKQLNAFGRQTVICDTIVNARSGQTCRGSAVAQTRADVRSGNSLWGSASLPCQTNLWEVRGHSAWQCGRELRQYDNLYGQLRQFGALEFEHATAYRVVDVCGTGGYEAESRSGTDVGFAVILVGDRSIIVDRVCSR